MLSRLFFESPHKNQSLHTGSVTLLAGLQWLGFMFANTIVIPLSVGTSFHNTPGEISGAMARSFWLTGLACLLQAIFGHRLPLMEGQSGLWWGVILGLVSMGTSAGIPLSTVGGSLAVGVMAGGLLVSVFGSLGWHRGLNRLFTPIVMAVLLFLLSAQLIDLFFQGMTGISQTGKVNLPMAGLALAVVLLVSALTIGPKGLVSNFAILIGLAVGWAIYELGIGPTVAHVTPTVSEIFRTFTWGRPSLNWGIILAAVLTALINTTNTVATLRAAQDVFGRSVADGQYRRSLILTGLYTFISGPFNLVPYAPYTSSIGFLRTTRLLARAPFMVGALLFTVLGAVPWLAGFFATMPISVGDAVLFVAYLQLFGSALGTLKGMEFSFRGIFRLALPVLSGLAILATPKAAFSSLPGFSQAILSNGMLVGILVSVLLEVAVPWQALDGRS